MARWWRRRDDTTGDDITNADLIASATRLQSAPPDQDVLRPDLLRRSALDFSMESLGRLDEYLIELHALGAYDAAANHPLLDGQARRTVIRGGAYLGEVIRRNGAIAWDWITYEREVREHPNSLRFLGDQSLGVLYLLRCDETGQVILPVNRVGKTLTNGAEDDTYSFAVLFKDGKPPDDSVVQF